MSHKQMSHKHSGHARTQQTPHEHATNRPLVRSQTHHTYMGMNTHRKHTMSTDTITP